MDKLSIIKNLKLSTIDTKFNYYYFCLHNSIIYLTDDSKDIKLIKDYSLIKILPNMIELNKYLKENKINLEYVNYDNKEGIIFFYKINKSIMEDILKKYINDFLILNKFLINYEENANA